MEETTLALGTLADAFHRTAEAHPDRTAVRTKDDEVSLTWSELRERVDALAGGLAGLGVQRGDTVALMLTNRPEFHIADLAVMTLGATPFSIYVTYTREQIEYLVSDSGAKVALIEAAFAERFPELEHVLVLENGWPSDPSFDAEPHRRAIEPDDLLTLIYTSGTTGPPKGVQLTHRNLMTAVQSVEALIRFPDGSKVISWLPAAHIAERMAHHYLPIAYAMTITCCPNPREVVAYLPAVRPTWFFAVPRIWEKLKAGLEAQLMDGQKAEWLAAAVRKVELQQSGEEVPASLAAEVEEADRSLFAGLRAMLGLDEAVAVNVGAAPTPHEVLVFFHAIGIPLAELWGMSETCGAGCCNPPDRIKIGSVGPAGPGVELKLGEDGELLMRSGVVMTGYRNAPDKTAEALDADGWLHTGDIAEIDDGRIRADRRPQEGDHHQRGRQEHVAGQHRVDPEGREPADRPGVRDRRRAALQHGADRARLGLRACLGLGPGHRGRPRGARARRAGAGGGPEGGRRRQREAGARGADQEVLPGRGRLAARR